MVAPAIVSPPLSSPDPSESLAPVSSAHSDSGASGIAWCCAIA